MPIRLWKLIGEGKESIAVVSHPLSLLPPNCVLLIRKLTLSTEQTNILLEDDVALIDSTMRAWYGNQYVSDIINVVSLDRREIADIIASVINMRSEFRQNSMPQLELASTGLVMRNFMELYKFIPTDIRLEAIGQNTLSFELKVKGGLKIRSPFIPRDRGIKLFKSRFWVMQRHKAFLRGTPSLSKISYYDPSNVCSQNYCKVRSELGCLLRNPQNNFKVVFNGQYCFGEDLENNNSLHEACNDFIYEKSSCNDGRSTSRSSHCENSTEIVESMLSSILCYEPILARLETMQALDLIDVEGAANIFTHLETCLGSRNEAITAIKSALLQPLDPDLYFAAEALRASNKVDSSKKLSTLQSEHAAILSLPTIVKRLWDLQIYEDMSPSTITQHREKAADAISEASPTDALLLLKLWMLALIAKDASVLVSMKVISADNAEVSAGECMPSTGSDFEVTLSNGKHCGMLTTALTHVAAARCGRDKPLLRVAYSVGLVDIGVKAIEKCWLKDHEEERILDECARFCEAFT